MKRRLVLFLATAIAICLSACVLLLDTDTEQCTTDGAPCTGPFAGRICRAGVCVAQASNLEAGPDAPSTPPCATNAECIDKNGGKPFICEKTAKKCVALENEQLGCRVLESLPQKTQADGDEIRNDATIWFGMLAPIDPDAGDTFNGDYFGPPIALARQDLNKTGPGLPAVNPTSPRRPIGIVQCDANRDFLGAARYLTDEVKVPAIFNLHSEHTIELANTVTIPKGVFLISSNEVDGQLAKIPAADPAGNRLVWRTTQNYDQVFEAIAVYVDKVAEPQVRAGGAVAAGQPIKVMLLASRDVFGDNAAALVRSKLRFNGQTADQQAGGNFLSVSYDPTPAGAAERASVASQVAAARPHVIIPLGHAEAASDIINPMEKTLWTPTNFRPLYVCPDGLLAADNSLFDLFEGAEVDAGPKSLRKRSRFIGIYYDTAVNRAFVGHYNDVVDKDIIFADINGLSYDAFFLTAYAALAVGDKPLNGSNIAAGVARLVAAGGRKVELPGIFDAFTALSTPTGTANLEGCGGPMDFNLKTGECSFESASLCYFPGDDGGIAFFDYAGPKFNPDAGAWRESDTCP